MKYKNWIKILVYGYWAYFMLTFTYEYEQHLLFFKTLGVTAIVFGLLEIEFKEVKK